MVKVGIIGVGTVGTSVAQILKDNADVISARAGTEIVVKSGVVKNLSKERGLDIALSTNVDDILDDPEIDIVVELMGGVEEAFEVVKKALKNGKAVVTANKALLAYHRYELAELAQDIAFEYEASVAGGIPIINALRDGLSANHIESIVGIMNGTCNYMMTKMTNEGVSYDAILKEAQELGYAEADPSFDVGGFDAAHKLLILASIAYGIDAKPEDILIEGIENVTKDDIAFAKEFGYAIKLLGIAKKDANEVELRVHASLISQKEMIAKIDGVMNGISVVGDKVGETLYYGPGAGGDATASAVVANIIDIARSGKSTPMLGFDRPMEGKKLTLKAVENITSKYYLRINVSDRAGVLAKITKIFEDNNISVETMLQRPALTGSANLLISTHIAVEKDIQNMIKEIEALEFVNFKPVMIRIV
ncbi:MAG: homoserine dehydrogenase [Epsilonproteobacteria bacterium]|nr:homoserine dehydrogenase [Campylobacterota bacterium]OIO14722.1 MAG: homoserine dehydrogenase [Helicobacteraceae bacterium CG1_02_36_14]PIP09460.1 MAG: homoserine dehydrogenase [Sulfurimonas sp. CG23_combo_of_CG06-09_8_20_14_all_36_33]PIS26839.1 MAG: homoserine dehydrogenase [Sulfurimonas sp. CG08_land_8_20_14_0_20_36_33]PIU34185.1 MAG: homoserine dehydrogenase [Sulfurimonas sp. CG07_land_8_20_14_0_80_36_56]PIV05268.1 MAG: homoserine dehydrogenase [Sulfurimonas sp. CG03_land_8_20_14_0_80_36